MTIESVSSLGTDYFFLDDLLTEEERDVRDRIRFFCDKDVIPIINDYWEREEFPFELLPKIAALNIAGTTIEGYGCPKMSATAAGLESIVLFALDQYCLIGYQAQSPSPGARSFMIP